MPTREGYRKVLVLAAPYVHKNCNRMAHFVLKVFSCEQGSPDM